MLTYQKKSPKTVRRYLENIVAHEGIKNEVDSWISFFNENQKKISPARYAQHVKAALTAKIKTRGDHNRIFALCDEINIAVFGPPQPYLYNHTKSSFYY